MSTNGLKLVNFHVLKIKDLKDKSELIKSKEGGRELKPMQFYTPLEPFSG
jgi:hypothetical protein